MPDAITQLGVLLLEGVEPLHHVVDRSRRAWMRRKSDAERGNSHADQKFPFHDFAPVLASTFVSWPRVTWCAVLPQLQSNLTSPLRRLLVLQRKPNCVSPLQQRAVPTA